MTDTYDKIDPIFNQWAAKKGLRVLREYQDEEVRSVFLEFGNIRSQLWLSNMSSETMTLNLSLGHPVSRKNKTAAFDVSVDRLDASLDRAYEMLLGFIKAEN